MLRVLGAAQKREVKATQNLSIIVLFFMICWMPLYTVNCVKAFCQDCDIDPVLMLALIALSHVNSAVNPLLYAYHLKDFRAALKNLILRILGKEVPRNNNEVHRRISAASRLQSMREKRSFQPRIYIDSPVWLRQQQAKGSPLTKADLANGSLSIGSALRSVVRVASTPTDNREIMSQIAEVPSQAERDSSKVFNENSCSQLSMRFANISKKSSQSSNIAKMKQASLDYYMSDEDDDDNEGGIKINFRHDDINLDSSSDNEDGEVFVVTSTSTDNQNHSDRILYILGSHEDADKDIYNNNNNNNHMSDHHLTDLPPFQHNLSVDVLRDENRFYEAYRRGLKGNKKWHGESTHSLEERGRRAAPPSEMIAERLRDLQSKEMDDSKYSSTGTISSENLTEFRDRSSSSVFIIESDTVQLSPSHSQSQTGTNEHQKTTTTTEVEGSCDSGSRNTNVKYKEIHKPSPLRVVTQLIFSNSGHGKHPRHGLSGKFNHLDMETWRETSNGRGSSGKASENKFFRSASDS